MGTSDRSLVVERSLRTQDRSAGYSQYKDKATDSMTGEKAPERKSLYVAILQLQDVPVIAGRQPTKMYTSSYTCHLRKLLVEGQLLGRVEFV